ncbi:hypothetical protein E3T24_00900 [Cryobacterium sp. TmT2-59]|uniref:hypothetical protein n=1 Tax=Cryobacterium sp. TmT2-59 TaxID=1259264 RepID=UPI00106B937C|nr:hypothetical protein [Cryobacterium sp. TmT2-59]TFC89521.1 hypothetical protein E3T24_00900 [Cryobacterium sp. TmT2-59]
MVRKIKAKLVLRLRSEGLSGRQIAAQGLSRHSVAAVLEAADRAKVTWDDVACQRRVKTDPLSSLEF